MADRISSLDAGYATGDLSLFPEVIDDKEVLYEATNNSQVALKHTLTYSASKVIVESTAGFPDNGIIRVGPDIGVAGNFEMIYYGKKTDNIFEDLIRGFAGSRQSKFLTKGNFVTNSVVAPHHNSIKDAIINIENNLGVEVAPEVLSLNGILKQQENRFLAPKALFRAFPIRGEGPMKVRFQNFSTGHVVRYLWDFGDGGTSLEKNPTHNYLTEGEYTVKLNVITSTGAQGVVTKKSYIIVDNDESVPFFYVDSISDPYSVETATEMAVEPKEFVFVDQTDGDITQRNWVFGDGNTTTIEDSDFHDVTHIYDKPGSYNVTELVQFANGRLKRIQLPDPLVVL
jgi:PKD repeat protein